MVIRELDWSRQANPSRRYESFTDFLTPEDQERLHKASILLAGCGAGSNVVGPLVRLGVATEGCLYLADPGRVKIRNLDRQQYGESDIGMNKVEALVRYIERINKQTRCVAFPEGITQDNVADLVKKSDVVIEMVDIAYPWVVLWVHDEARKFKKPVVTGLDLGFSTAQSFIFDYRQPDNMGLRRFLGLSDSLPALVLQTIDPLLITAQYLLGPVPGEFNRFVELKEYYANIFKSRGEEIISQLPPEMQSVLPKILRGKQQVIPQSPLANQLLGNLEARQTINLILNWPVKEAPAYTRISLN